MIKAATGTASDASPGTRSPEEPGAPRPTADQGSGESPGSSSETSLPTVGIGMTLHNNAQFLPEALDSLLAQTYRDFVMVLVDDASSDETEQICRNYAARDPRLHYYRNQWRSGMVATWRRAFDLTSSHCPKMRYFAWASDHDRWHPKWLGLLLRELKRDPEVVLAYPVTRNMSIGGKLKGRDTRFDTSSYHDVRERFQHICVHMRGAGNMVYGLFRANALRRAGIFRPVLLPDKLLMAELAFKGVFRQVEKPLWYRRQTGISSLRRQRKALFVRRWHRVAAYVPWYVSHSLVLARSLLLVRKTVAGLSRREVARMIISYCRTQRQLDLQKQESYEQPAGDGLPGPFVPTLDKVLRDQIVSGQAAIRQRLNKALAKHVELAADLGARDSRLQAALEDLGRRVEEVSRSLSLSKQGQKRWPLLDEGNPAQARVGPALVNLGESIIHSGRTLLDRDRLYVLWQAVRNVAHLEGAAVEVGSYRGGSAYFLASCFLEAGTPERPLYVIDTFDETPGAATDEDVRQYLSRFNSVRVLKGEIPAVARELPDSKFALLHMDVDLYRSTLACLQHFGHLLVEGGVIVVNDYGAPGCPGVARAVHEYLSSSPGFVAWDTQTEQLILTRMGGAVAGAMGPAAR